MLNAARCFGKTLTVIMRPGEAPFPSRLTKATKCYVQSSKGFQLGYGLFFTGTG